MINFFKGIDTLFPIVSSKNGGRQEGVKVYFCSGKRKIYH